MQKLYYNRACDRLKNKCNRFLFRRSLIAAFALLSSNALFAQSTIFNYTGSMQAYIVPAGITKLKIVAKGAQGGNNGGTGAIIQGDITVAPGETLNILVGGQGLVSATGAGGGGGSFVVTTTNTPLIIAGGGGGVIGSPVSKPGIDAHTGTAGNDGYSAEGNCASCYGVGGTNGNGGTNGPGAPAAGNGGGFNTNGTIGAFGAGYEGRSYLNGGAGGTGTGGSNGGYGGAGGGDNWGAGGGGGYSGGGGSWHHPTSGGGAGSYNSGTNQVNASGASGNTGNGQVVITPIVEPALNFDGTNDYISLPASVAGTALSEVTVEAWIKNDGTTGDIQAIVSSGSTDFLHFQTHSSGDQAVYTNGGGQITAPIIPVVTGTWRHVAMTVKSGEIKVYVNGVQLGSTVTSTYTSIIAPAALSIGRGYNGGRYFKGSIDEVRIWNTARTQSQIQANMNCDIAQQAGLIAYYRLNEGAPAGNNSFASIATDYSGNKNCGALNNFALTGTTSNFVDGTITTCNTITPAANPTAPTIAATANTVCSGGNTTLSINAGSLNNASNWNWYSGTCGGTAIGSGTSVPVSPATTTTYYARAEGSCLSSPGSCDSITITMKDVPAITSSPADSTICEGTNASFTAAATGTGITYQWQEDSGSGFTNISNGTVYSGATSATLTITNAAVSLNNNKYRCVVSGDCSPAATSADATLTVNPTPVSAVSVTTNTNSTTVCQGVAVIFNAAATNGGTNPGFVWQLNGTNVSTTGNLGSSSIPGGLSDGDVVIVTMTPNITCAVAVSDTVTMTVNPYVAPTTASISIAPGNNICSGTSVTFTAAATGAGTTPSYQWLRNGANVGTNSATYTSNSLNHLDVITCVVKSGFSCAGSLTSNAITMSVTPTVAPTLSISTNTGNTVCAGTAVQFVATPTASGISPIFEWKLNGVAIGTNSNSYNNSAMPAGNHVVTCKMTSNASCITTSTVTATYNITVNPVVTPAVSISSPQVVNGNVCSGTNVTFTATPANGGSTPVYQWKKNGVNVGTNAATYAAGNTLATGDVITCTMTSNAPCTTTNNVVSNAITITVYQNTTASVNITSSIPGNEACIGIPVTFTATPTNGGPNPTFQWRKDGVNIPGATANTYIDPSTTNGVITCRMTTNLPCATPATATSNSINLVVNQFTLATVDIYASLDSIGCTGDGFVFTSYFTNGGTKPTYQWFVNGQPIAGAKQAVFQGNNFNDGDAITCQLTSSAICVLPVLSDPISLHLTQTTTPSVNIYGLVNTNGITFHADVADAGTNPQYQWLRNNIPITGATTAAYTLFNYAPTDKITLQVESSDICASPKYVTSNTLKIFQVTGVGEVTGIFDDIQLFPNPNEGRFSIKGNVLNADSKEAGIEILNAVGQVVYREQVKISNGALSLHVDLGGKATAGMYMVRIHIDGQTESLRFILK